MGILKINDNKEDSLTLIFSIKYSIKHILHQDIICKPIFKHVLNKLI